MATTAVPQFAEELLQPLHVFRFHATFKRVALTGSTAPSGEVNVCSGAFAECTGLEATMEPKVIKAGGMNYGAAQRVGPVTFSTVILKRGMTTTRHLWDWFVWVGNGAASYRLDVLLAMQDRAGSTQLTWQLRRALPIKFKAADLNAKGTEVGIEELHLAHEGLWLAPSGASGARGGGR